MRGKKNKRRGLYFEVLPGHGDLSTNRRRVRHPSLPAPEQDTFSRTPTCCQYASQRLLPAVCLDGLDL